MNKKTEVLKVAVPCEIFSRCCGYFRPINQWNKGKKQEFRERHEWSYINIQEALSKPLRLRVVA